MFSIALILTRTNILFVHACDSFFFFWTNLICHSFQTKRPNWANLTYRAPDQLFPKDAVKKKKSLHCTTCLCKWMCFLSTKIPIWTYIKRTNLSLMTLFVAPYRIPVRHQLDALRTLTYISITRPLPYTGKSMWMLKFFHSNLNTPSLHGAWEMLVEGRDLVWGRRTCSFSLHRFLVS